MTFICYTLIYIKCFSVYNSIQRNVSHSQKLIKLNQSFSNTTHHNKDKREWTGIVKICACEYSRFILCNINILVTVVAHNHDVNKCFTKILLQLSRVIHKTFQWAHIQFSFWVKCAVNCRRLMQLVVKKMSFTYKDWVKVGF